MALFKKKRQGYDEEEYEDEYRDYYEDEEDYYEDDNPADDYYEDDYYEDEEDYYEDDNPADDYYEDDYYEDEGDYYEDGEYYEGKKSPFIFRFAKGTVAILSGVIVAGVLVTFAAPKIMRLVKGDPKAKIVTPIEIAKSNFSPEETMIWEKQKEGLSETEIKLHGLDVGPRMDWVRNANAPTDSDTPNKIITSTEKERLDGQLPDGEFPNTIDELEGEWIFHINGYARKDMILNISGNVFATTIPKNALNGEPINEDGDMGDYITGHIGYVGGNRISSEDTEVQAKGVFVFENGAKMKYEYINSPNGYPQLVIKGTDNFLLKQDR